MSEDACPPARPPRARARALTRARTWHPSTRRVTQILRAHTARYPTYPFGPYWPWFWRSVRHVAPRLAMEVRLPPPALLLLLLFCCCCC